MMDIRTYFKNKFGKPSITPSTDTPSTIVRSVTPTPLSGLKIKLAIVGSRTFKDYTKFVTDVNRALDDWGLSISNISTIVSGGAKGADTLAEQFAINNNIGITRHFPDWKKYGRAAGLMRNTDIINNSDYVIAFPSRYGKGTQDSIRKAQNFNPPKKLKVIFID